MWRADWQMVAWQTNQLHAWPALKCTELRMFHASTPDAPSFLYLEAIFKENGFSEKNYVLPIFGIH